MRIPGVVVTDDLSGSVSAWTLASGWLGPCPDASFPPGALPDGTNASCSSGANCSTCADGNHVFSDAHRPAASAEPGLYFKEYVVTDAPGGNVARAVRRVRVGPAVSTGAPGCKCVNESIFTTGLPISSFLVHRGERDCIVVANSTTADEFCYPTYYGISGCRSYEEEIIPVCAKRGINGRRVFFQPIEGRPSYCASPWCYVDPASCDSAYTPTPSSFFTGMYYSYATCGPAATFDEVHERFERSSSGSGDIDPTIIVIIALAATLVIFVGVAAWRAAATKRRKERPCDFRKIIAQLQESHGKMPSLHRFDFKRKSGRRPCHRKPLSPTLDGPGSRVEDRSTASPTAMWPRQGSGDGVELGAVAFREASGYDDDDDDDLNVPPELGRQNVHIDAVLGKGQFGQVCQGTLTTFVARVKHNIPVAIKMVLDSVEAGVASAAALAAQRDFLEEAVVTWQFDHPNVVQMYGVVTSGLPYLLVLELCENGELLSFVQSKGDTVTTERLLSIVTDVATGMEYLTSKHFVHRDLAARNVLLDDDLTAKVCDFGLGRQIEGDEYYRTSSDMLLPIRWTDPWAFENQVFNEATDVWSFGVMAIEVFSRGNRPYGTWPNYLVLTSVKEGYRHPRPQAMPEAVYREVVRPCWRHSGTDDNDDGGGNGGGSGGGGESGGRSGAPAPAPAGASDVRFDGRIRFSELARVLRRLLAAERESVILASQSLTLTAAGLVSDEAAVSPLASGDGSPSESCASAPAGSSRRGVKGGGGDADSAGAAPAAAAAVTSSRSRPSPIDFDKDKFAGVLPLTYMSPSDECVQSPGGTVLSAEGIEYIAPSDASVWDGPPLSPFTPGSELYSPVQSMHSFMLRSGSTRGGGLGGFGDIGGQSSSVYVSPLSSLSPSGGARASADPRAPPPLDSGTRAGVGATSLGSTRVSAAGGGANCGSDAAVAAACAPSMMGVAEDEYVCPPSVAGLAGLPALPGGLASSPELVATSPEDNGGTLRRTSPVITDSGDTRDLVLSPEPALPSEYVVCSARTGRAEGEAAPAGDRPAQRWSVV